jgi:hypothetical protein
MRHVGQVGYWFNVCRSVDEGPSVGMRSGSDSVDGLSETEWDCVADLTWLTCAVARTSQQRACQVVTGTTRV